MASDDSAEVKLMTRLVRDGPRHADGDVEVGRDDLPRDSHLAFEGHPPPVCQRPARPDRGFEKGGQLLDLWEGLPRTDPEAGGDDPAGLSQPDRAWIGGQTADATRAGGLIPISLTLPRVPGVPARCVDLVGWVGGRESLDDVQWLGAWERRASALPHGGDQGQVR